MRQQSRNEIWCRVNERNAWIRRPKRLEGTVDPKPSTSWSAQSPKARWRSVGRARN
jgi:hypothetical protein